MSQLKTLDERLQAARAEIAVFRLFDEHMKWEYGRELEVFKKDIQAIAKNLTKHRFGRVGFTTLKQ